MKSARNLTQNVEGDLIKPLMPFQGRTNVLRARPKRNEDNEDEETQNEASWTDRHFPVQLFALFRIDAL